MHDFRVTHGATELMLIRHAEAEHPQPTTALEVRDIDMPLTHRGHNQANRLANRIAARHPDAIYASPLKRTMETAQAIADATGLTVHPDDRLREVEIGDVGPVSLNDLAEIALAQGGWSHLPGTESAESIRARMRDIVDAVVADHPGQRVALVTHAGAINAYITMLLGLEKYFFFPAFNASISLVRARENRRLIVTINDIAHLEGMK